MPKISVGPPPGTSPYRPRASDPGRADLSRGISVGLADFRYNYKKKLGKASFQPLERNLSPERYREEIVRILYEAQGREIEVIFRAANGAAHEGWLEAFEGFFVFPQMPWMTADEPFSVISESGVGMPEAIVLAYHFREGIGEI